MHDGCGSSRWGGKEVVVMVMGTVCAGVCAGVRVRECVCVCVCVMGTGTGEGEVEAGRVCLGE